MPLSGKARPNEDGHMFCPLIVPILLPSRSPADPRSCLWCCGQALAGWGHLLSPSTSQGRLCQSCCPSQLLGNEQNRPIIAPAKKYSSTRNKKSPPYCQSQSRQGKLRSLNKKSFHNDILPIKKLRDDRPWHPGLRQHYFS